MKPAYLGGVTKHKLMQNLPLPHNPTFNSGFAKARSRLIPPLSATKTKS
jgi:hypothetical protein